MKYKVGDHVRIKSLDWYNKNKSKYGNIVYIEGHQYIFDEEMSKFCGKIMTISDIINSSYMLKEDNSFAFWKDEMIEGLVKDDKLIYEENGSQYATIKAITLPDGYQFVDENGNIINVTKIILEKKKKEYPKTYEECCKVLGYFGNYNMILTTDVDNKLFNALYRLKVCRDAYWKIAGDEMRLGKTWKPDWEEKSKKSVITTFKNAIAKFNTEEQYTFAFPTEEMRDAFYENFKELIEECKELL